MYVCIYRERDRETERARENYKPKTRCVCVRVNSLNNTLKNTFLFLLKNILAILPSIVCVDKALNEKFTYIAEIKS